MSPAPHDTIPTPTNPISEGANIIEMKPGTCQAADRLDAEAAGGAAVAARSSDKVNRGGASGRAGVIASVALAGALAIGLALTIRAALTPPAGPATPNPASPETIDAILNAAQTYLKEDELGKAEAILKEAIAQHVEEQRLYSLYGEVLVAAGRHAEAYEQYVKALAVGPRGAELEFTAGTVANMAELPDRAIEHYATAQASAPTDPRIPLYMAQVQIKKNELTEAQKNLLIAGRLDPDVAIVWGTLAEVLLKENKPEIAISTVRRARELEPQKVLWRLLEARAVKRLNRPEDALQLLVGLSDAQRMEPGVLPLMAECYGMLSRPADAGGVFARASDMDAENPAYALQAAQWLEKAGNLDGARRYAERAARLEAQGAAELLTRLGK